MIARRLRGIGRLTILVLGIVLAVTRTASAEVTGHWVKAAPFPVTMGELYGASVAGKLIVFGGLAPGGVAPAGVVYEYDPASDTWTRKHDMARPAHHTAQAALGGKIYVFGGFAKSNTDKPGWLPTNDAEAYDPAADTWTALAPMPTPRGAAIAVAYQGKIYVIGGAGMHPGVKPAPLGFEPPSVHRSLPTVEVYDPAANRWAERSPMPTARNHIAAAGAVGGRIYVIGGRIGSVIMNGDNIDLVESYDPATDSWGALGARMPTARSGGGYGVYHGKIYVGGGEFQLNGLLGAYRAFEVYDPASNSWQTLPYLPEPRHGCMAAFIGNKLHIVGGTIQSDLGFSVPLDMASHAVFVVDGG
jgi:N-acetylneuraminic acid mutarotase